ncbi:MAG: efflux RND transporter permease subunit, partial [Clostridiales bacterium]
PLAFTGGFLALIITGLDVSVISLLGFLVLTGVVVNNGIVLVDYINRLQAGGMEHIEAIILGGKTRLRPILMTALTTILGLTTMALGVGMGAEMVQPMAVVCIGGLLYATILTLFVVPVIYDISRKKKKKTDTQGVEGDLDIFEITDADDIDEIKNR